MKKEIGAAVRFIGCMVRQGGKVSALLIARFEAHLRDLLQDRFMNHWHPEAPWKGQGYRCLRVNELSRCEETILCAASEVGLDYALLNLPLELTLWIDPGEVACRFGEESGSYGVVASFTDEDKENCPELTSHKGDVNCTEIKCIDILKEQRDIGSKKDCVSTNILSSPNKICNKSNVRKISKFSSKKRYPEPRVRVNVYSPPFHNWNAATPSPIPPFGYPPNPSMRYSFGGKQKWNLGFPRYDRHNWGTGQQVLARV